MIGRSCDVVGCFGPVDEVLSPKLAAYCDPHLDGHRLDDADMWLAAASKRRGEIEHAREEAAFAGRISKVKKGQWT